MLIDWRAAYVPFSRNPSSTPTRLGRGILFESRRSERKGKFYRKLSRSRGIYYNGSRSRSKYDSWLYESKITRDEGRPDRWVGDFALSREGDLEAATRSDRADTLHTLRGLSLPRDRAFFCARVYVFAFRTMHGLARAVSAGPKQSL